MPYTVPGYTEISHFRAPYKDSMMGFGAAESTAASSSSMSPSTQAQAQVQVQAEAKALPAAAAPSTGVATVVSPAVAAAAAAPIAAEKTVKAVVDAAKPGSAAPYTAVLAPKQVKKLADQVLDAKMLKGRKALFNFLPKKPETAGATPMMAGVANRKWAAQIIRSAQKKHPRLPKNEVQKHVQYFLSLLDEEANYALRGPDKRLWPMKPVPTWDELWRTKGAILANRKARFHKLFKEQLAKLLRNHDALDAKLLPGQLFQAAKAGSFGYTMPQVSILELIKGGFGAQAVQKGILGKGAQGRVFPSEKEALLHFYKVRVQNKFGVNAIKPGSMFMKGLDNPKFYSNLLKENKPIRASLWGLPLQVAIEDALKADLAEQEKLLAFQRRAAAVKAAIELKKSADKKAQEAALKAAEEAKKAAAKADADLKLSLKKSEDNLAKAQADNAALKTSIEDLKSMVTRELQQPQVAPPAPPPPPPVKEQADALPVPKNEKGELPDPDKLVAKGESAKEEAEVDADVKAAGLDKPSYLPYVVGAGALAAIAFIALKPKRAATATANRRHH